MGGESIYGRTFSDEDLTRPLDAEGLLCMANRGPDTQSSQFFVTLRPCPHLNGKHCVFGRVVRGFDDVVEKIAQVAVDDKSRPLSPVVISNCGELELRKQPPPGASFQTYTILELTPIVAKPTVSGAESEKEEEELRLRPKSKRAVSELETEKDEPPRTRRRSRSRSPDNSDSSKKRHHKKSKRKHKRDKGENVKEVKEVELNFRGETEEEYDARLEREEKERLDAARKSELEQIKRKYEVKSQTKDGVTFKG